MPTNPAVKACPTACKTRAFTMQKASKRNAKAQVSACSTIKDQLEEAFRHHKNSIST